MMCTVHNDWYVGSTTDLRARWRNHKSDAKLRKATKCGVAD
ncbi:GIY-YIG nuclease family protein, partial [Thiolapillus sp.]